MSESRSYENFMNSRVDVVDFCSAMTLGLFIGVPVSLLAFLLGMFYHGFR